MLTLTVFVHASELSKAYASQYVPKPDVEGLGENVQEFQWFILAFVSSWLISVLVTTPLTYIAMVLKDTCFGDASDIGKMHVSIRFFVILGYVLSNVACISTKTS